MKKTANRVAVALTLVLVVTFCTAPAGAQASSPAEQLAERYSPELNFEPQARECGPGEAYRPASVDILLGRKGVVLRNSAGQVTKAAPTAADIFGRGESYYLDFPGNPLRPGCGYERDYRLWNGNREPVVYAHLGTDTSHPGKLSIGYWYWYTFNDSKNKHEGDWEMAQVDFDAATAEQALMTGPYQINVAQHAGGERSSWSNPQVSKDGTHPLLYVSTGSHATYFGRALYLGRSPHEGFGCDNTRLATQRVALQTVLLPDVPKSSESPYAWMGFDGRWGERLRGINNGPTGPWVKEQWSHPIAWANELRPNSVTVPGTRTLGPTVTNFFCDAVTQSSVAIIWGLGHPAPFLALLALLPLACLVAARRTTWRPPSPYPIQAHRGGGQIIGAAVRLYAKHRRIFLTFGLVFIPVSLLTAGTQWVLFHLTGLEAFVALDGKRGAVTLLFTIIIGNIGAAFASVLCTAAVAFSLNEMAADRPISAGEAIRATAQRVRPLAAGTLIQYFVTLLLSLTVVGIPLAIHRFIRWSLFAQACMLDGLTGRESLAKSSRLVRGRWWRTFGFTVLVDVLALLSGILFGLVLLLLSAGTLNFIDIASSLVYVLTVPFAAIALTLYYFELGTKPADRR